MAAQIKSLAMINDTDANFRLWSKAISDQLVLGGWVRTADTGQIDFTTVTKPTAGSEVRGYEVFRSDDGTGGLNQFYLKIEYGSGSTATMPGIWVQYGWSSDGAGNLVNTTSLGDNRSTRTQIGTSNSSSTLDSSRLAAGLGWAAMQLGAGISRSFYFSVERSRNDSGLPTDELLIATNGPSTGYYTQVVSKVNGAYPRETTTTNALITTTGNAIQNGVVGLNILFGCKGKFSNPYVNILGAPSDGALGSANSLLQITMYGTTRTYVICPLLNPGAYFSGYGSTPLLLRFE